jgi:hypothetical protein
MMIFIDICPIIATHITGQSLSPVSLPPARFNYRYIDGAGKYIRFAKKLSRYADLFDKF